MKKIRFEIPFYALFFGLIILGLYFGVIKLREWANPTPNLAIADVVPIVKAIDQKPYKDDVIIENRIYVDKATLDWPGFVAVYEDVYNKYDTLVGTSRFLEAGTHTYVPVDLVKEYKQGQRLYVVLHKDNGDAIYNLVQDFPVRDRRGFDIADSFSIRVGGFGHGK
ncbi:MAG: hypothetical protein Q8Q95_01645 [bacterium]|nr:hypothetical protein [bacterium]